MEFEIYRKWFLPTYTIGVLSFQNESSNWVRLCNTLEDVVRVLKDNNKDGDFDEPGEGKIYGKTAIPYGRYRLILHFWAKYGKEYPMLLGVPGYSGIYIHSGTTEEDTLGCPLVGENREVGKLTNGRYWTSIIVSMIHEAERKGENCYITIRK